jgi:hypothetical protein
VAIPVSEEDFKSNKLYFEIIRRMVRLLLEVSRSEYTYFRSEPRASLISENTPVVSVRKSLKHGLSHLKAKDWFPILYRILRDLGFGELEGLDIPPQLFLNLIPRGVSGEALIEGFRQNLLRYATDQLSAGGSTLFFDIEEMSTKWSCVLIPLITQMRTQELENMTLILDDDLVSLEPLWLTTYGRLLLESMGFGLTTDALGLRDILSLLDKEGIQLQVIESDVASHSITKMSDSFREYVMNGIK